MKILVGGVPFGTDNIGDEAILSRTVAILREVCPKAILTVATANREGTEAWLGVRTCPLYGFEPEDGFKPDPGGGDLHQTLRDHDVFLWAGATGLSDYPHVPLRLLEPAQRLGKKTVVFGTGMNSELNPMLYTTRPGRKQALLSTLSSLTLNRVNLAQVVDTSRQQRLRQRIHAALTRTGLVIFRDPQSQRQALGPNSPTLGMVGADSAITVVPQACLPPTIEEWLQGDGPVVAVCISAQQAVQEQQLLANCLDDLVKTAGARLLFVPMNPKTDGPLMQQLREGMDQRGQTSLATGLDTPEAVAGVLARVQVAVSSRLHLLILASISHVPLVGIGRGSKIDNYLELYGLEAAGTTERLDYARLRAQVNSFFGGDRARFAARSRTVRAELLERLERAKEALKRYLEA